MSDGVLKDIQNMLETPSMRQGGLPTISSVPCTRKCSTLLWVGKSLETCRISQMFSALSSRTSAFIDGPKEQKLIMPWLTNTCGWHFAWNVPFLLERNPGFKSGTKLHPIKKKQVVHYFWMSHVWRACNPGNLVICQRSCHQSTWLMDCEAWNMLLLETDDIIIAYIIYIYIITYIYIYIIL